MKVATSQNSREDLLDPSSNAWQDADTASVPLKPVPLDAQPNAYIRTTWADRKYGETASATAAVQSAGDELFVRLEWSGSESDGEFVDGAGVISGTGAIDTLGNEQEPVTIWRWAKGNASQALGSNGPGVFSKLDTPLEAAGINENGKWTVVISGSMDAIEGDRLGVVIWNGSNDERAGLAAVSSWLTLETE